MKVQITFDKKDVVKAVNAGLKKINLFEISKETILTNKSLDEFMAAALKALEKK